MLIDDLLSLETEELLNFRFTEHDFLIWPFIRRVVLEKIYFKLTKSSFPVAYFDKKNFYKKICPYLYHTFCNNPFKYFNFPIVLFNTQRTVNFKKDGKYFNRLTDYFALEYPDISLIVERTENQEYKLPRYFENITFEDYIYSIVYFKMIFKKHLKEDEKKIKDFIIYLKSNFNNYLNDKDIASIYKKLIVHSKVFPLVYDNYRKLFDNLKPKVIISVGRGSKRIYLYKAAKDYGIKVAELQHGFISNSHILYNYSEDIINSSEYSQYLPDYLLTFGSFWNNCVRDSAKKIVIGNPHLINTVSNIQNRPKNKSNDKKIILIVSQGTHTKEFVETAKEISKKFDKQYVIYFKLHPAEVLFEERYKELYTYKNIQVCKDGDIYEYIFVCDFLIGCYSTVVLEALAFKKTVFILDNNWSREFIPSTIGKWFKNTKELIEKIDNNDCNVNDIDLRAVWETNCRKNYRNFIENEIGLKI